MGVIWDGVGKARGAEGAQFTGGKIHLHTGNKEQYSFANSAPKH